jgi:hypothetical protein
MKAITLVLILFFSSATLAYEYDELNSAILYNDLSFLDVSTSRCTSLKDGKTILAQQLEKLTEVREQGSLTIATRAILEYSNNAMSFCHQAQEKLASMMLQDLYDELRRIQKELVNTSR